MSTRTTLLVVFFVSGASYAVLVQPQDLQSWIILVLLSVATVVAWVAVELLNYWIYPDDEEAESLDLMLARTAIIIAACLAARALI